MNFLRDENGQGAAEYLLLFGGVIAIAVGTLIIYNSYFTDQAFDTAEDVSITRSKATVNERSLF